MAKQRRWEIEGDAKTAFVPDNFSIALSFVKSANYWVEGSFFIA